MSMTMEGCRDDSRIWKLWTRNKKMAGPAIHLNPSKSVCRQCSYVVDNMMGQHMTDRPNWGCLSEVGFAGKVLGDLAEDRRDHVAGTTRHASA